MSGRVSIAWLIFAGISSTAGMASAQDLPPGVLLLSRVENHIKDEFQRLATISCLETAQRQISSKGKMRPLDTVRLEVLTNGDKELFASPGDRNFSEEQPLSFAGSGMLGNGLFGPYLKNVLLNGNATTKYVGEEDLGGRRVARYDYEIAPTFSGQSVEIQEGSGTVGLRGSFWVDPETYDVLRLDLSASDIPPTLPLTELATSIHYGRTVLTNNLEVLLPETADVRLEKKSGEISQDQVEFTHCRVFGAESTLSFSVVDSAQAAASPAAVPTDEVLEPLPGGQQVAVKLSSPISSDTPVGALIEGVVADEIKYKHEVLIPAGSLVRGRIRRLERYSDPFAYFVIGIEFTEVDVESRRYLFYADVLDIDDAPGVELTLQAGNHGVETLRNNRPAPGTVTTLTRETIVVHNLPGVATFFFRGDTLNLPKNFRTVWKTRALKQ